MWEAVKREVWEHIQYARFGQVDRRKGVGGLEGMPWSGGGASLGVRAAGEEAGGRVITGRPRRQGSAGALSKGTREIVQEETEEGAGGTRKCCED